jgi:hypothetical protein
MNKRLECRDNDVYLVLGSDGSRAKTEIFNALEGSYALEWKGKWASLNSSCAEYRVRKSFGFETLPAKTYCFYLGKVLQAILEHNENERAVALIGMEMDLVEIDSNVETLYKNLKESIEKIRIRCMARTKAFTEDRAKLEAADREYNNEVIWRDKTRGEIRNSILCGTLAETSETKTLYEMFDSGML